MFIKFSNNINVSNIVMVKFFVFFVIFVYIGSKLFFENGKLMYIGE